MRVSTTSYPTIGLSYPNLAIVHLAVEEDDVSPGAWWTVAAYTVPAGRVMRIQYIHLHIDRLMIGTGAATTMARVQLSPDGIAWTTLHQVRRILGVVGDHASVVTPCDIIIPAGHSVRIQRRDDTTGGRCNYRMYVYAITYTT